MDMAGDDGNPWWKKLAVLDFKLRVIGIVLIGLIVAGGLLYRGIVLPATCDSGVEHLSGDGPEIAAFDTGGTAYNSYSNERVSGLLQVHVASRIGSIRVADGDGEMIYRENFSERTLRATVTAVEGGAACNSYRVTVTGDGGSSTYRITGQMVPHSMLAGAMDDR